MEHYTSVLSAATALLAVILGPVISMRITNRQIRANNFAAVAAMRQKWIDDLRDELSRFAAGLSALRLQISPQTGELRGEKLRVTMELFRDSLRSETRIRLMLSPHEPDHAELMGLIRDTAHKTAFVGEADEEERDNMLGRRRDEIVAKSQAVLKREWERVKVMQ